EERRCCARDRPDEAPDLERSRFVAAVRCCRLSCRHFRPGRKVLMSHPTDPALTVRKPQNASPSGHLDETSVEKRGRSSGVIFGPPADAGEVGTLGPYRVLKTLGKGGMGAVYLAVDTRLDRKLALKVMLPEFAANRDARERFLREAKAAAKISHDNVVTVY